MSDTLQKPEKKLKQIPTWRIFRRLAGIKFFLGVVEAPDAFYALHTAIKAYNIPAVDHGRLTAEKHE